MKTVLRIVWAVVLMTALLVPGAIAAGRPATRSTADDSVATADASLNAPAEEASDTVPGEWVVGVEPAKLSAVVSDLKAAGIDAEVASPKRNRLRVDLSGENEQAARTSISALDGVEYVSPNQRYHALAVPTDPGYAQQWGLPKIGMPAAWDVTRGAPGVTIAVIDTGVDLLHQDLQANIDTVNDFDFVDHDYTAQDEDTNTPGTGHGTHVAGIAAASWNNGFNGAGVAPDCTILPIRVLDEDATGDTVWVAAGIEWAADKGADVINLSLGGNLPDPALEDAINYARGLDVVVVAAAGNHQSDEPTAVKYPGAYPGVLGVAATDTTDTVASFSNFGPEVDISAPGVGIWSTGFSPLTPTVHSGWRSLSGTSMATPFAAGAAALLRAEHPAWNEGQVRGALLDSAVDLGDPGRDDYYGEGRLDAAAALAVTDPTEMTETVSPTPSFDDDLPGIRLLSSPVVGTLDAVNTPLDEDDVYRVWLEAGEVLYASVTSSDPTSFDLWLLPPGSSWKYSPPVAANATAQSYPHGVNWRATSTGWHYIDVEAWPASAGAGEYTLTWSKGPQLVITPSNTTPAYGTNTRVYADFAEPGGDPIVGEQMALLRWDSSAGGWEKIATAPTGADGVATFTVSPTSKATYTVGVDVGSDPSVPLDDAGRTITPHVYLSAPWTSSSTLKRTTTYTWYATLRPEHPSGQKTVLFKTYRLVNGSYRYYKTFYGTNADYLTYTRSSARIRLPYSGKWKVIGWTASDAGHAQTTGPARYVTVK